MVCLDEWTDCLALLGWGDKDREGVDGETKKESGVTRLSGRWREGSLLVPLLMPIECGDRWFRHGGSGMTAAHRTELARTNPPPKPTCPDSLQTRVRGVGQRDADANGL